MKHLSLHKKKEINTISAKTEKKATKFVYSNHVNMSGMHTQSDMRK